MATMTHDVLDASGADPNLPPQNVGFVFVCMVEETGAVGRMDACIGLAVVTATYAQTIDPGGILDTIRGPG